MRRVTIVLSLNHRRSIFDICLINKPNLSENISQHICVTHFWLSSIFFCYFGFVTTEIFREKKNTFSKTNILGAFYRIHATHEKFSNNKEKKKKKLTTKFHNRQPRLISLLFIIEHTNAVFGFIIRRT